LSLSLGNLHETEFLGFMGLPGMKLVKCPEDLASTHCVTRQEERYAIELLKRRKKR
jgi:hypothetical protein